MVTEGEEGETKVTEASVSEDYLVLECKPITSAFTGEWPEHNVEMYSKIK